MITRRSIHRGTWLGLSLLLLGGSGCVPVDHFLHGHTPLGVLEHHDTPYYHCPECGRVLTSPHHDCQTYVEHPFFGYSPTCWRPWPAGWVGCPIIFEELEVIEGHYLPGQGGPLPGDIRMDSEVEIQGDVDRPPSPPLPQNQPTPAPRQGLRPNIAPLARLPMIESTTDEHSPIVILSASQHDLEHSSPLAEGTVAASLTTIIADEAPIEAPVQAPVEATRPAAAVSQSAEEQQPAEASAELFAIIAATTTAEPAAQPAVEDFAADPAPVPPARMKTEPTPASQTTQRSASRSVAPKPAAQPVPVKIRLVEN